MNIPEPDMQTYSKAVEMLKRRSLRMKWARVGGLAIIGLLLLTGSVRLAGLATLAVD